MPRRTRFVPTARFQTRLGSPVIDEAAGVIRGCRIATLNAVSEAEADSGRGLVMDSLTLSALFSLATSNGGKIPAFFSHDWYESDRDPLHYDAGVWQDFEIRDGNLTATFAAFETPYKAGIFSRAKADPNSIAVSPMFDYEMRNGSKNLCTPTRFISSDFVKLGAINKAIFNQTGPIPMTIDELIALLDDPKVKAAIKAILEAHDDAEVTDADADALETEAGVMDADKKPDDKRQPALMRATVRIARATARMTKELGENRTAILAEARTQAEAAVVSKIGTTKFVQNGGAISVATGEGGEMETYITAQLAAGCKNRGAAIARMAKDKPKLYNEAVKSGALNHK